MITDEKILEVLGRGNSTPGTMAAELGVNPQYIWQRLRLMELQGRIRKVGRGLYALITKEAKQ